MKGQEGIRMPEAGADGEVRGRWLVPSGIHYGLCAAFGAFFAISGVTKVLDPILFRDQILGYEIVGDPYAAVVAVGLPWVEILCGAVLVFGVLRTGALAILVGLLAVFLVAILSAWVRGLEIECGCFGSGEKGQYALWIIRNVVLIACGVFLMVAESMRRRGAT